MPSSQTDSNAAKNLYYFSSEIFYKSPTIMKSPSSSALLALLLLWMECPLCSALFLHKLRNDFNALTQKVTAHHILLPPDMDLALRLKQKIRHHVQDGENDAYLVDTFEAAARKHSHDPITHERGGLIGELVPQGYCASVCPELDQACFEVRLGVVEGPIKSKHGYHLLLVSERHNCPELDGHQTKLVPGKNGGRLVSAQKDLPRDTDMDFVTDPASLAFEQLGLWTMGLLAGSIAVEIALNFGMLRMSWYEWEYMHVMIEIPPL